MSLPLLSAERARLTQQYWSRPCTGRKWLTRFPGTPKEDIRAFLQCLVDGFGFDNDKRLKFVPEDKILDIYQAVYPPGHWYSYGCDCMEVETFLLSFERRFDLDLPKLLEPELTLGELFDMAKLKSQSKKLET